MTRINLTSRVSFYTQGEQSQKIIFQNKQTLFENKLEHFLGVHFKINAGLRLNAVWMAK